MIHDLKLFLKLFTATHNQHTVTGPLQNTHKHIGLAQIHVHYLTGASSEFIEH